MASLLLRRALLSMSKPLTVLRHHTERYSSLPLLSSACRWSTVIWEMSGLKQSPFLASSSLLSEQQQHRGMKTKSAVKKRCEDCYIVKRRGRLFVYCKSNNKHKQRQG